jgi:GTPase SAR1 family protein
MNKTPEMRIALFGPSSSGKTTLLASYYGNQQRNSFEEQHGYRLAIEDTSIGNRLLSRYYKMEAGEFPLGTEIFEEYCFNFMVHELTEPSINIVWYDYPGGWWENAPKDNEEEQVRREAFKNLLQSHVGVLIIDGEKYNKSGVSYIHYLLDQFKNEIRKVKDYLASEGEPIEYFPNQWVIVTPGDKIPKNPGIKFPT